MKVSELTGALLDYWVARAEGLGSPQVEDNGNGEGPQCYYVQHFEPGDDGWWTVYDPSIDWAKGGPIVDAQRIYFEQSNFERNGKLFAYIDDGRDFGPGQYGETRLIAAMRAYVASKFGDEVPDDITHPPAEPVSGDVAGGGDHG